MYVMQSALGAHQGAAGSAQSCQKWCRACMLLHMLLYSRPPMAHGRRPAQPSKTSTSTAMLTHGPVPQVQPPPAWRSLVIRHESWAQRVYFPAAPDAPRAPAAAPLVHAVHAMHSSIKNPALGSDAPKVESFYLPAWPAAVICGALGLHACHVSRCNCTHACHHQAGCSAMEGCAICAHGGATSTSLPPPPCMQKAHATAHKPSFTNPCDASLIHGACRCLPQASWLPQHPSPSPPLPRMPSQRPNLGQRTASQAPTLSACRA